MLLAAGATGLWGQIPGMFPWWDSPVARDLNLSDDQQKQIRAAVSDSRTRLIQLRGAVEAAEGELADLMNDDPVDARKANESIEKVTAARSELTRAVSQMSLKLRMILTAQQWQELQRRRPPRPPGPPGAPMGPGPGGPGRMRHPEPPPPPARPNDGLGS